MNKCLSDEKYRRLMVTLTCKCNLHCRYCNMPNARPQTLLADDVIYMLDQVKPHQIGFSGGELFLEKEVLYRILRECKNYNLERIILTTNGTLLTKKDVEILSELSVTDVIISIDGMKKTHDYNRGSGNFEKTISGLKLLLSYASSINITVNTIISQINLTEIPTLIEFLYSLGLHTLELHPIKLKEGLLNLTDSMVKEKYNELWTISNRNSIIEESFNEIYILKKKYPKFIGNTISGLILMKNYLLDPAGESDRKLCDVYKRVISLTYEGRICFCLERGDSTFQISTIDEIKKKGLETILTRKKTKRLIEDIKNCKEPCMCLTYHENLEEVHLR